VSCIGGDMGEVGADPKLLALHLEGFFIEASGGGCRNAKRRGDTQHSDIIRASRLQAGICADIDKIRLGEGIAASQVEGLARNAVHAPSTAEIAGITDAEIGARAAFDPVVARELVALE